MRAADVGLWDRLPGSPLPSAAGGGTAAGFAAAFGGGKKSAYLSPASGIKTSA